MLYDFLKNDDNELNGGASEDLLRRVETTLGMPIPRAWKEFLSFSNGAVISTEIRLFPARMKPASRGHEEDDAPDEDLILGDFDREDFPGLDRDVLVIGRICDSDYFCYLREDAGKDDPPVYMFDDEVFELSKVADNALEFLTRYNGYFLPENLRKMKRAEDRRQLFYIAILILTVAGTVAFVAAILWLADLLRR